jgi:hypothetical protein
MNRLHVFVLISVAFVVGAFGSEGYGQIRETGKPAMVQQCQENFDAMDANKDGVITKEEFLAFEHKGRNAEGMFTARDADSDGALTKDELCAGKGMGKGRKQ